MRILVTGGAGFIGSHLSDRLLELGHDVVVFDNLKRGRLKNIEQSLNQKKFKFIEGDIRDPDSLSSAINHVEVIYHLAAQSNVLGAVSDLNYSFETNVAGTFNVLKCAKNAGIRKFIFSSSREVYGEAQYVPVDEAHPLNSKNLYGASKIAGEKYCEVFQNMGAFEVVIFRFANVYGTRDYDRVIPIFLENVAKNKNMRIYGGSQVIDFISVQIATKVLINALDERKFNSGPINVGSGKGTTLFELAEKINSISNSSSQIIREPGRSEEVVKFIADIQKLKKNVDITIPEDPLYGLSEIMKN